MLEARITYNNGRTHIVEANTLDMLKSKCKPFIENNDVLEIWVYQVDGLGALKSEFMDDEDLL